MGGGGGNCVIHIIFDYFGNFLVVFDRFIEVDLERNFGDFVHKVLKSVLIGSSIFLIPVFFFFFCTRWLFLTQNHLYTLHWVVVPDLGLLYDAILLGTLTKS